MYRKILKVFLASPGDLADERIAASQVVEEENRNHAHSNNLHIELVGWEETVSQTRRAQEAINRDLDQCEYFVGMMWQKWGSPPGPEGHPYTSGFEEEYCRSLERRAKSGKPDISLLFKSPNRDRLEDPGNEMRKVLEFRRKVIDEQKILFQEFGDVREFEQRFRAILSRFLREQIETTHPEDKSSRNVIDEIDDNEESSNSNTLFDYEANQFISNLISIENSETNINSASIARLRLLANSVHRQGNDPTSLGVHDSNILYRHKRDEAFSHNELRTLVTVALEHMDWETVPLWHWLKLYTSSPFMELTLRTLIGPDSQCKNALKLLRLSSYHIPENQKPFSREKIVNIWLGNTTSRDVKIAVFAYLEQNGNNSDIELIEPFLDSDNTNISSAAVRAKIGIIAKSSTSKALNFVASREDAVLTDNLVSLLLESLNSIETQLLKKCLTNRSDDFRRLVAEELLRRDQLSIQEAQQLCESDDAWTRLIGALALKGSLDEFSFAEAQKILDRGSGSSLSELFLPRRRVDFESKEALEAYKITILADLPAQTLEELSEAESVHSTAGTVAYYKYYFRKSRDELRKNLKDRFQGFYRRKLAKIESRPTTPDEKKVETLQTNMMQLGLEALCSSGSKRDLGLVRDILDDNDIAFSSEIVEFLKRHGEWEDVCRVLKLSNNLSGLGFGLLQIADRTSEYASAADAILKLSQKRIADTLALEIPPLVRVRIYRLMPKRMFASFSNQNISELLLDDNEFARKAIALKALLSLSKTRLRRILELYYRAESTHYYNAIFWLDLGISVGTDTARAIANKELSSM